MAHAHLWTLNGRIPEACLDMDRWARWFEKADTNIASTELAAGELLIVTRFRPFCDRRGEFDPPPLLFETVVLDGIHAGQMFGRPSTRRDRIEVRHYATWEEAEAGHQQVVERYAELLKTVETAAVDALGRFAATSPRPSST